MHTMETFKHITPISNTKEEKQSITSVFLQSDQNLRGRHVSRQQQQLSIDIPAARARYEMLF